jgi:FkbM family methyltransferase
MNPSDAPPAFSGPPVVEVDAGYGKLLFPQSDGVMLPFIARTGSWEPEETALVRRLARPGCRFLDIGANVGYFACLVATECPGATVDAVEPHPLLFPLLRLNLWRTGSRSCTAWGLALTDGSRTVALETTPTNLGDTRAVESFTGEPATMVAPGARGDDLFAGRQFDLVKLDVQGLELAVITGMLQTLRNSPGVQMLVEFMPSGMDDDPAHLLRVYRSFGFTIRMLRPEGLVAADDAEIVELCASGGPTGQVTLLLAWS